MNPKDTELFRIWKRDKGLKPSAVVAEAEAPASPLHSHFEWDDGKAGHEYRLQQARKMIRAATVVIHSRPTVYVHVPPIAATEREGVYQPIPSVIRSRSSLDRYLDEMSKLRDALQASMDRVLQEADRMGVKLPPEYTSLMEALERHRA